MMRDLRDVAREILIIVKRYMKYKDLYKYTGLPPPVLWRYISNNMRPSHERAEKILSSLVENGVLRSIISRHIRLIGRNIVNIFDLVYNKDLVRLAAYEAYYYFRNSDIDAVATVEIDGIPLAAVLSALFDINMIVAKRRKELGHEEFYEETYLLRDPPVLTSIYVPKDLIPKNSKILIVDDLLRSGRTLASLINIIKEARAVPRGVFSIVAVGSDWMEIVRRFSIDKVHVMVHLPE
ncbi:MAG: phosphoribosyltransferase family protein [Sulfolobales archaeon]